MPLRRLFVFVHRYVGLAMALFLVIASLTGSVLAYYYELDCVLNPSLYQPESIAEGSDVSARTAEPLDVMQLRARLEEQLPYVEIGTVPLNTPPGQAVPFFVMAHGHEQELENDEFFLDPYTGSIVGKRKWGDLSQGSVNLLPFFYKLHYSLAMGSTGEILLGIIALLWSIDCFVGAYLTFPAVRPSESTAARVKNWWKDWGKSWLAKTGALYKLTFTWHRASGLWLWGLLFVFAWSAVGLTLHNEVYHPVMKTLFPTEEYASLPDLESPQEIPAMDWDSALHRGRALMAEEAAKQGFVIERERRITYDSHHGVFRYQVASNLDINQRYPSTTVWFDHESGQLVGTEVPTGQALGNTLTTWLYALHFGAVGGGLYQAFVALLGILVTILSVSGVYIWWVKFRARRMQRRS